MMRGDFANLFERKLMDCLTRGWTTTSRSAYVPSRQRLGIWCLPLRKVFMGAGIGLQKIKLLCI